MTPRELYVTVEPDPSRGRGDSRQLLCTCIDDLKTDFRVSVWWGGGRGEVHFSLKTGKATKKAVPYQLRIDARQAVVRWLRSERLPLPDFCGSPGWPNAAAT